MGIPNKFDLQIALPGARAPESTANICRIGAAEDISLGCVRRKRKSTLIGRQGCDVSRRRRNIPFINAAQVTVILEHGLGFGS